MKITEVKGKDFDGKVYRNIDLNSFGDLKTPDESCIIATDCAIEWSDGKDALNFNFDIDFLKTTPKMAKKIYNKLIDYYTKNIGNFSVYPNGDAQIAFGIYKKDDNEWILVALDSDAGVFGLGIFGGEKIEIGVDHFYIAHASCDKCITDNSGFFDDKTMSVLFTKEDIQDAKDRQNK